MYADRVVLLKDLSEARALLGDIDGQVLRTFALNRRDDGRLRLAAQDRRGINALIAKYKATVLVDAERRGLKTFDRTWATYQQVFPRIQGLGTAGDRRAAATLYHAQAAPLYAQVDGALKQLSETNDAVASRVNTAINAEARSGRLTIIAVTGLALLFGLGIALRLSATMRRDLVAVAVASPACGSTAPPSSVPGWSTWLPAT